MTITKLENVLKKKKIDYEIIVSSDGSTDDTLKIAKKLNVKAVGYDQNKGFTTALRYGFQFSTGEIIINLPSDVDNFDFLDSLEKIKNFDVVSISKRHPESVIEGYGFFRWLVSNTFHSIEKLLFDSLVETSDTHYISIYKRKVLETVYPYCKSLHWGGETEAIVFSKFFGFTLTDSPIHLVHESVPGSFIKQIKVYWKTLLELLDIKFRLLKMKKQGTK